MAETPAKVRKAQQRARDRALGWFELRVKVHRDDAQKMREYAAELATKRSATTQTQPR